jgi:UDP-N-acetylmuramoyl-tripeptide--D-alanyl-D-alanine ligase
VIPMTLAHVARAVGGELQDGADPSALVTGPVVADSRQVSSGALFVALAGDRTDGHDHAADAIGAGAVACLVARRVGQPAVVVPDVLIALGRLARSALDSLPGLQIIAITGSAGKTSTKDLLAQVLASHASTVAPRGSFNNELGLPLTVLSADPTTHYLVLEMGARALGHVSYLCTIAPPDIAVVLMVGTAHVGEFGDRDTIAAAKSELVASLSADGVAVLNADDAAVRAMTARTGARIVWFGAADDADVRAANVVVDERGRPSFDLTTSEDVARVHLQLAGAHQVTNALAAAAVAREAGLSVSQIAQSLSSAAPLSRWRMEVVDRPDGVTVINDAYNASPESVHAALETLAVIGAQRRTWAVLGEMRELGAAASAEHATVGRLATRLDIDRVVLVGTAARSIDPTADESPDRRSVFVPDVDAAIALLSAQLRPGDVVLVKAARAVGLERVAQALLEPFAGTAGAHR